MADAFLPNWELLYLGRGLISKKLGSHIDFRHLKTMTSINTKPEAALSHAAAIL